MLAFSHFYRLNTLILGQFPCFSGIFHIKPLDRPIFLNYPENLQLLLMDLPIELDLTGTNRYYANLLMTYSALPEEQRSQFRNMIQRLECSLDGDHLEQNDTGVN